MDTTHTEKVTSDSETDPVQLTLVYVTRNELDRHLATAAWAGIAYVFLSLWIILGSAMITMNRQADEIDQMFRNGLGKLTGLHDRLENEPR